MPDEFNSLCDDFYLDMSVHTELELPSARDTVLAFFERIQKHYPQMGNFYRRRENEYCLESRPEEAHQRWVSLDVDRLASGVVNPDDFEEALEQHKLILELAPYMLSLSPLDIDCLDLMIAMDFECPDNHDGIIAEAVLASSAFDSIMDLPGAKPIAVSPTVVFSLSEDSHTQARVSVESKTTVCDPRKWKELPEQAISLSLTVRQYPLNGEKFDPLKSLKNQLNLVAELMQEKMVPHFVRPLINAIAHRRLS